MLCIGADAHARWLQQALAAASADHKWRGAADIMTALGREKESLAEQSCQYTPFSMKEQVRAAAVVPLR